MKYAFILAVLLLSLSLSAFSETVSHSLEEVVVTASRTPQAVSEILVPVSVITREDIVNLQAQSLKDVLIGLPGVLLSNSGGAGKSTSIFLRGTESDHVLVLVDGIKIGSATSGTPAIENIPIEQIERIEIVRGPRASLYGSEALGGVIQIFTHQASKDLKPSVALTVGEDATYSSTAGLSWGGKRSWFNVSTTYFDTEGFNACKASTDSGCFTVEMDNDGYESKSGTFAAGYHFENGLEIEISSMFSEGENEFDGSYVNESNSQLQTVGTVLRFSPTEKWDVSISIGNSQDNSDSFYNKVFMSRFDTERDNASVKSGIYISDKSTLLLGLDYQNDSVNSTETYVENSRTNTGLFAQYSLNYIAHDIQLSIREDDNEQFGRQSSFGVSWAYHFAARQRFLLTYGTAFKAPSFNELYFPGFGNTELEPEEASNVEMAYEFEKDLLKTAVNIFQTEIDNLIVYDASIFAPSNINQARIRGLEFVVTQYVSDFNITANLTVLDPENRSQGENRGKTLARRAKNTLRIDVSKQLEKMTLGTALISQSKSYDDAANSRELEAFNLVELRGSYRHSADWLFQLRLENLFDEEYETAAFYNQPGRSVFFTVRYTK